MSNTSHLTTKEVARLCDVSDATVKRWEDAGMLHSVRTGGGHRRFRAEEVARFQRSQGIGSNKSKSDDAVLRTITRQRENKIPSDSPLFDALVEGCEEKVNNLIIREYLNGTPLTEIFDVVISSAMARIGELWYAGELTITQEHLATRIIYASIHKLRDTISASEPIGKIALCCTAEGDMHELPSHLAQIILEKLGWEVVNFGANTPLYCFGDEVSQYKPDLVCITAKTLPDSQKFSREYKTFREKTRKLNVPVVLGGQIFRDARLSNHFEAELIAESFADFEHFALKLMEKS